MTERDDQIAGPAAGRAATINPAAKKDAQQTAADQASPGASADEAQAKERAKE